MIFTRDIFRNDKESSMNRQRSPQFSKSFIQKGSMNTKQRIKHCQSVVNPELKYQSNAPQEEKGTFHKRN